MNGLALPTLNTISLCTGGAGLDLGLELAIPTARAVAMVEREAYAAARLVAAFAQGLLAPAALWDDVRTFDGRPWRGRVDGLIGGIPCQPHSHAGRKRGTLDERDLWTDARRIVVQGRPWFVLIENVTGMLSAGADEIAGANRVRRDLLKLGYAVEGGLFRASEVGSSQERERIFILGVDNSIRFGQHEGRDDHGRHDGPEPGAAGEQPISLAHPQRHGRPEGFASGDAQGRQSGPDQGSGNVADARSQRPQGGAPDGGTGSRRQGRTAERGGGALADAQGERPQERRRSSAQGHRQASIGAADGSSDVGHSSGDRGGEGWPVAAVRQFPASGYPDRPGAFPPGPDQLEAWAQILLGAPHLEPSIRRVADGMADRVDRLRLLGNGVVPLQAAYAIRTLVTRLAARGCAGAIELLGLMA